MKPSFLIRFLLFSISSIIVFSVVTAVAATNTVPATSLDDKTSSISLNNLRPAACAGISVMTLITGSGVITGTSGNDLILASAGPDTIDGLDGNDCIIGGNADDLIAGGDGNDFCLGGPGDDGFISCEGQSQ